MNCLGQPATAGPVNNVFTFQYFATDGDGFGILGQLGKYGACVVPFNGSEFLAIWGRGPTLVRSCRRSSFLYSVIWTAFWPRYDYKGVVLDVINAHYRGTVPPIKTPRKHHACATYVSDQGEQVAANMFLLLPHYRVSWSPEESIPMKGNLKQAPRSTYHQRAVGPLDFHFQGKKTTLNHSVTNIKKA